MVRCGYKANKHNWGPHGTVCNIPIISRCSTLICPQNHLECGLYIPYCTSLYPIYIMEREREISISIYIWSYIYIYSEREREKQHSFPCKVALQSSPGSLPLIRNYGQLLLKDRSNGDASDTPWEIHRNCRWKVNKNRISKFQGGFCYYIFMMDAPDFKLCLLVGGVFIAWRILEVSIMQS